MSSQRPLRYINQFCDERVTTIIMRPIITEYRVVIYYYHLDNSIFSYVQNSRSIFSYVQNSRINNNRLCHVTINGTLFNYYWLTGL